MLHRTTLRRGRKLAASLFAFVIGLAGLIVSSPTANAAEVDAIVSGSIKLTRANAEDPLYLWSMVRIDADWAIPDGTGKAGDTFKLGLPEELQGTVGSFDLKGKDGDETVYGSCEVALDEVVCTLNSQVENKYDVGGSLWVDAQVVKRIDTNQLNFTLYNNGVVPVPLPNGQVGIGYNPWLPTELVKDGWFLDDPSSMRWRISVPGSAIQSASTLTISDTYSVEGVQLTMAEGYPVMFSIPNTAQCWNENWLEECRESYDASTTPSAAISVDDANDVASVELDNKGANFDPDRIYIFEIVLKADQPVPAGTTYSNKATVNGEELTATTTKRSAGAGTGGGKEFGGLAIKKAVTGTSEIPADTVFPVAYSYEHKGETKTGTLQLKADGTLVKLPNLPTGAVVTLTEQLPTVSGVQFGDPVFSGDGVTDGVPDATSAQVTVQGGSIVELTLTNPASKIVTVVPVTVAPGVCEEGSTTPTPPTITGAEDTDDIDYSTPEVTVNGSQVTVTLTATPKGAVIDTANLPEGWSVKDNVVTYTATITQPECTVATPPAPTPSTPAPSTPAPSVPAPTTPAPVKPVPKKPGLPKTGA